MTPEKVELGRHLFYEKRQDADYLQRFEAAFGNREINWQTITITKAIAAFERNLTSFDSPYDRYRYSHDKTAISDAAKRGEMVFLSAKLQCFRCHLKSPFVSGFRLSDREKTDLLAFLNSLTDKIFINNPSLSDPNP